jgi:hypothetical protein
MEGMWDAYRHDYGDIWNEPIVSQIGNKTCNSTETVAFAVLGTDQNGHALTYAIDAATTAKGATINSGTGAFSWVTEAADVGINNVYFTVTNDQSRAVYQGITITVSGDAPPSEAEAPILQPISDQRLILGQVGSTDSPIATDVNGGTLTFTSTPLPTGLTISSTTGVISGTPTNPGRWPVTITVTDSTARADSETFTIEVSTGVYYVL